jgi:hypothetical protein
MAGFSGFDITNAAGVPISGTSFTITMVPEPATALLTFLPLILVLFLAFSRKDRAAVIY